MKKFDKILLIDDNDVINFYNEDVVEETGLFESIEIITSGTKAIAYFEEAIRTRTPLPNLVFLDIKMPDYDGFEILEELEELYIEVEDEGDHDYLVKAREMVVCMLTTSQHKRDLELFETYDSAVAFLEKPLTKEKVLEIVNCYLKPKE